MGLGPLAAGQGRLSDRRAASGPRSRRLGTRHRTGALLALTSALCYGIVDFAGGLLSRRVPHAAITFLGRLGGLLLAAGAALLLPADALVGSDLLWGALSGVGSATAMRFLNRGLSFGAMSAVAPVSAVTVVLASLYPALPVVLGLAVLHERTSRRRAAGLLGAAPATVLLTVG